MTGEATRLGFSPRDPDWCNLGQGQPETGEIEGAPPRITKVEIDVDEHRYGEGLADASQRQERHHRPGVIRSTGV